MWSHDQYVKHGCQIIKERFQRHLYYPEWLTGTAGRKRERLGGRGEDWDSWEEEGKTGTAERKRERLGEEGKTGTAGRKMERLGERGIDWDG